MQNGVVHGGQFWLSSFVFTVAGKAVFMSQVKTCLRLELKGVLKRMADDALLIRDPFPGDVAVFADSHSLVRSTQRAWLGSLLHSEQPD